MPKEIVEGKKKRAIRFEEEIVEFLKKLEFEYPDGAKDNFIINGIQVDACAGHEDTLLIIECTRAEELKGKSLRDKIKEIRSSANTWEKGFKSHPTYKRYKYYKYILAINNIEKRDVDIDFANSEKPQIYIWDDNFIDYYKDLHSKIKQYAKFNLLGEIHVRPAAQNTISVPAFLTTIGKTRMYAFMIDPRELLEVSYVARREVRGERYYQRLVKKERLAQITKYINEGNILPNNLIIAFGEYLRKYIKFHILSQNFIGKCTSALNVSYGILEFPRDYRSCWIIDGQHRLYAFVNSKNYLINMPVIAFENIDLVQQCKFFLDINKNQKPVPPDLVWDLNGDMVFPEEDGIISRVVKALNEDRGAIYHKIHIPSKGLKSKGLLKIAGICLSLKRMRLARENTVSKTANPLYDQDPEKLTKKIYVELNRYFTHVQSILAEDWEKGKNGFVLHDSGIAIMLRLFERIISRHVFKGLPAEADYVKYLSPLNKLFQERYNDKDKLKDLKLRITSEGGRDKVIKEICLYIQQETKDNLFGGQIEPPAVREIIELERKLKEVIRIILGASGKDDWLKDVVPPDIYGKAVKRLEKHGETDFKKAYMQLMFGECCHLMRQNKTLFYPLFKKDEYGFGSDYELEGALDHICRIRIIQETHDIGVGKKIHDENLFRLYLDKINKCVDSIISSESK
jgi:DNA sulfur modification protein DndB